MVAQLLLIKLEIWGSSICSLISIARKGVYVFEGTVDTLFDRMLKMVVFPSRRNRNALKVSYLYPMKRECKTERR